MLVLPWAARAERDNFFTGTGKDGAYTAPGASSNINIHVRLTAAVDVGDLVVPVAAATGLAAGDLIMLHQSPGINPVPAAGPAGPVDLTTSSLGRWELARISSIAGLKLTLTRPLVSAFGSTGAQVVRVPEFTTVTINSGTSISCNQWNGTSGGVLAFLATGTVTNNLLIHASSRGFRSGNSGTDNSGTLGATGLDQAAPSGAQKWEGLAITRYGTTLQQVKTGIPVGAGVERRLVRLRVTRP